MGVQRFFMFLILVVNLAIMPVAAMGAPAKGVPVTHFDSTLYNFPTVVEGVVITHAFTLKNLGSADLKVEKVKTG